MSKAHFVHYRYVAIKIEGGKNLSRREIQTALTRIGRRNNLPDDRLPNLTRFGWPHAIIRVQHMDLEMIRRELPKITSLGKAMEPVTVETLLSSGTIKTLTDRLGILAKR